MPVDLTTPIKLGSTDYVQQQIIRKLDALGAASGTVISDDEYGAAWNGVTDVSPSKNAVYDKIQTLATSTGGVIVLFTDDINDDAVWSRDLGREVLCGDVTIVSNDGNHRGLFGFRTAATAFLNAIGTATGITATTGALTGTTGSDTEVTASTHTDNRIYIENRSGGTLSFHVNIAIAFISAVIEFADLSTVEFGNDDGAEFA